eukprot:6134606-Amphidinium_carterae.1
MDLCVAAVLDMHKSSQRERWQAPVRAPALQRTVATCMVESKVSSAKVQLSRVCRFTTIKHINQTPTTTLSVVCSYLFTVLKNY